MIKERITKKQLDKERKLTPEQIEAIYSNGSNILCWGWRDQEKPCHGWAYPDMIDVVLALTALSQPYGKGRRWVKERPKTSDTEQLHRQVGDEERAFLFQIRLPRLERLILNYGCLYPEIGQSVWLFSGVSPIFRIMTDPAEQGQLWKMRFMPSFSTITCIRKADAQLFQKLSATSEMARLVSVFLVI